jgi:dolichol-phosphate mannosyltransferase
LSSEPGRTPGIELTVVIPTLNEADNVLPLLSKLDVALQGLAWEVVFVDDDSRDGTADRIREISQRRANVRVLQRIGRRGLTSACMEGMMASAAPYVAVMDADLQHDESLLPRMLATMREKKVDLVVASRHTADGSMGDFAAVRILLSNAGKWVSKAICRVDLKDPMSGYFLADRRMIQQVVRRMSGVSFKVLVDIVSSSPRPLRVEELPYSFRSRLHGESKLDPNTLFEFGILIAHKLIRGIVPARFVLFLAVGTVGAMIHLAVLGVLLRTGTAGFLRAQATATAAAMLSNFWLNNSFTFRDRRRRGRQLLTGALSFFAGCSIGGLSSIALAQWLFLRSIPWYLAGIAGTALAAVWNFAVTSVFTWPERR